MTTTGSESSVAAPLGPELFGYRARCLDLPWLIRTKRAAGRPRDLEAIAEMEALAEESGRAD